MNEEYIEPQEMNDEQQDCFCDDEPQEMSDVEADANTLASAGWGTDENYEHYGLEMYYEDSCCGEE